MKKRKFTILILVLLTICINAQNNDLLIGKWVFKEAYNKEKIDRAGLEMLNSEVVNKMTFNFMKNGKFEAYLMGETEQGNWTLSKDSKKIYLFISGENSGPELEILKLTKTELALKLGFGEFLMKKTYRKRNAKYKKKKTNKKLLTTEVNPHKNIEINESELIPFELIEEIPITSDCNSKLEKVELRKCVQKSIIMHVNKKFNADLASTLGLAPKIHKIITTFIIDKNGEIVNVHSEGSHPDLNNEAERVISILPNMKPGMKDGKTINVKYTFPIHFKVE